MSDDARFFQNQQTATDKHRIDSTDSSCFHFFRGHIDFGAVR